MVKIKQYQSIEDSFFQEIKKHEKSNLLFYCLTGSLGQNNITEGWSDIDILMVFKEYSTSLFSHIDKSLNRCKSTIKIGTTFYSLSEFNNAEYFKDPKTCHTIELIKKNVYVPKIQAENIILPDIDKELLKIFDIADMGKYLHNIKRELIDRLGFDEHSVYKQIICILKILLYRQDILVYGYRDILLNARKYLPGFKFRLLLPKEIVNYPNQKYIRYNTYIDILDWVKDYKIDPIIDESKSMIYNIIPKDNERGEKNES